MQDSVDCLVRVLESYRGRDRIVRTLCYGSQLIGGVLSPEADASSPNLGKSLLLFSAQLSHCRTVLRLFDDISMLAYSHGYGFGAEEEDGAVRWISVLANVADQLYYPCEHVAWAADAHLIQVKSDRWWLFSTALWGTSLLLGILSLRLAGDQPRVYPASRPKSARIDSSIPPESKSLRVLLLLKRRKRRNERDGSSDCQIRKQVQRELLSVIGSVADLSNAIHWMPHGFLWGGQFPTWVVGLMGTISSLTALISPSCSA